MGVSLRPVFYRTHLPFTILRRAGTCAAVDAPDEFPTVMDAVVVEVSPRRTRSRYETASAEQCSLRASMTRHA